MAQVRQHGGPFLFMAEGVFMYLEADDIRLLVRQIQVHLGKDAMFRSGIRDSREMEQWHSGIQFLDE